MRKKITGAVLLFDDELTGGAMGEPEQVARLVHFLASDDSDLITGTEIRIDGAKWLLRG